MSIAREDAIAQIASGVASLTRAGDYDSELVRKVVAATLESQDARHASIVGAVGAEQASCQVTKINSIDCGKKLASPREPEDRQRRRPIRWGGSECITILGCTICYEYECSASFA